MSKVPIALQLFSVRGECQKDLAATLKAVSAIGYVAAEPWGYRGEAVEWLGHSAADVGKMFADSGLQCCGIHLATGALLGDNLARTIELNQTLGNRFLVIAGDKDRMSSRDTILELAEILNGVAQQLKPHNMFTGYHAHPFDFGVVEGQTAWQHLFSNVGPDVIMQMDIGNCARGDGDPVAMLRKFPRRARTVHLKEHGGDPGAVIGEGDADWDVIFDLCETQHATEWYVVEEGGPDGLGFEVSTRSYEALRAMGKC